MKPAIRLSVLAMLLLAPTVAHAQKKTKGKKKTSTTQTTVVDLDAPAEKEPPPQTAAERAKEQKLEAGEDTSSKEVIVAPKKWELFGFLGGVLPIGSYATANGFGIGLSAEVQYRLSPMFRASGRLGFEFHLSSNSTEEIQGFDRVTSSRSQIIPLLVGLQMFPSAKHPYYATFETGVYLRFATADTTGAAIAPFSQSATKFNYGVGIGGGAVFGPVDLRLTFGTHDVTSFGSRLVLGLCAGYHFVSF